MPKNIQEIEANITGKVQLVMYRDFVQRKARVLKLTGTVQNMDDGSVQVVAQGDDSHLKTFIEHLREGPILAKVDDVQVEWRDAQQDFENFVIVY